MAYIVTKGDEDVSKLVNFLEYLGVDYQIVTTAGVGAPFFNIYQNTPFYVDDFGEIQGTFEDMQKAGANSTPSSNMAAAAVYVKRKDVDGYMPELPEYKSSAAAGLDIAAAEKFQIFPGGRYTVSTGLYVKIPYNCVGRILPRSGLAIKQGIDVFAGVIDADYTGELKVVLYNSGKNIFNGSPGDRIAQLVIQPIIQANVLDCVNLPETDRGSSGFGSTGV